MLFVSFIQSFPFLGQYKVLSFYFGINALGLHIPIEITNHLTESAGLQDCQQSIFVQKILDME